MRALLLLAMTWQGATAAEYLAKSPQELKTTLSEVQKTYIRHAWTVKAKVAADVQTPVVAAFKSHKGGTVFGEPLKPGSEGLIKVVGAGDLNSIEFFSVDKRLQIIPKLIHRETATSRPDSYTVSNAYTTITTNFTRSATAEILFLVERASVENAEAIADGTADTALIRLMKVKQNDIVELASTTAGRQKANGRWFPVRQGKLFSTLEFLTGVIDNCRSQPGKIADQRHPESEFIARSSVLNSGADRVTLAYFIRVKHGGLDNQVRGYFSLFSYDLIGTSANGLPICATEFFLFGPFEYLADGVTPNTNRPPLLGGLAIGSDAQLIPEVPLDLAKVSNYRGGPATEPIRPGVGVAKEGCLKCHAAGDPIPDATGPFPWRNE